ncbi:MAG: Tfp pilus assembly protein FimT/FimU [Aquabacterium sp.]
MPSAQPLPRVARSRGLTLLELAAVLAIVAIVTTAAVPSLMSWVARQRLKAAAEQLAAQLTEARFEAVRRGVAIHFSSRGEGGHWCWAIGTVPGLNCSVDQPSALRMVRNGDHAGVQLLRAEPLSFEPRDGRLRTPAAGVQLRSARGEVLAVRLTPLGRATICSPDMPVPGANPC